MDDHGNNSSLSFPDPRSEVDEELPMLNSSTSMSSFLVPPQTASPSLSYQPFDSNVDYNVVDEIVHTNVDTNTGSEHFTNNNYNTDEKPPALHMSNARRHHRNDDDDQVNKIQLLTNWNLNTNNNEDPYHQSQCVNDNTNNSNCSLPPSISQRKRRNLSLQNDRYYDNDNGSYSRNVTKKYKYDMRMKQHHQQQPHRRYSDGALPYAALNANDATTKNSRIDNHVNSNGWNQMNPIKTKSTNSRPIDDMGYNNNETDGFNGIDCDAMRESKLSDTDYIELELSMNQHVIALEKEFEDDESFFQKYQEFQLQYKKEQIFLQNQYNMLQQLKLQQKHQQELKRFRTGLAVEKDSLTTPTTTNTMAFVPSRRGDRWNDQFTNSPTAPSSSGAVGTMDDAFPVSSKAMNTRMVKDTITWSKTKNNDLDNSMYHHRDADNVDSVVDDIGIRRYLEQNRELFTGNRCSMMTELHKSTASNSKYSNAYDIEGNVIRLPKEMKHNPERKQQYRTTMLHSPTKLQSKHDVVVQKQNMPFVTNENGAMKPLFNNRSDFNIEGNSNDDMEMKIKPVKQRINIGNGTNHSNFLPTRNVDNGNDDSTMPRVRAGYWMGHNRNNGLLTQPQQLKNQRQQHFQHQNQGQQVQINTTITLSPSKSQLKYAFDTQKQVMLFAANQDSNILPSFTNLRNSNDNGMLKRINSSQQQNHDMVMPYEKINNSIISTPPINTGISIGTAQIVESSSTKSIQPTTETPRNKHVKTFPVQLMDALKYIDDITMKDIAAWLPDNKHIAIIDPNRFLTTVIQPHFKAHKNVKNDLLLYPSFTRKLRNWGFERKRSDTGFDTFYHPLFCKTDPDSANKIEPRKCKKNNPPPA